MKNVVIMSVFISLGTTFLCAAAVDNDTAAKNKVYESAVKEKGFSTKDGTHFKIVANFDRTETWWHDDDTYVNIRQNDDETFTYVSGDSGLIDELAESYYNLKGFEPPEGKFDKEKGEYVLSSSLRHQPVQPREADEKGSAIPSSGETKKL